MRKFKIGDRVICFYTVENGKPIHKKGRISDIFTNGGILVSFDDVVGTGIFHKKQIRKLVSKKKTKKVWQWRYKSWVSFNRWVLVSELLDEKDAKDLLKDNYEKHTGPFEVSIV